MPGRTSLLAALLVLVIGGPAASQTTAKVWENYDFVPGSKVPFFTDFSEDKVGNFARRLKYQSGPVEVVELDGVKVLRSIGPSQFLIPVGRKLPDRFTLEFDIIAPNPGSISRSLQFEGGGRWDGGAQSARVAWGPYGTWLEGSGKNMGSSTALIPDAMRPVVYGNVAHVRVLKLSGRAVEMDCPARDRPTPGEGHRRATGRQADRPVRQRRIQRRGARGHDDYLVTQAMAMKGEMACRVDA